MDFHNTINTRPSPQRIPVNSPHDPAEALQDFPEDALSGTVQLARDTPVSPMMYS